MNNNYETVFILTPVLPENQVEDAVKKFKDVITNAGGEMINEENWGLKKMAYPIQHKSTGFYILFEYEAPATTIAALELEFRRDERIMRFLTTKLDKHAVAYNEKRRKGAFKKKAVEATPAAE